MGLYGYESDEDSWGRRSASDADCMQRRNAQDSLGIRQPVGDEDICSPECAKWERQWRKDALAAKGLREFDGTGETAEDGVAFTEGMYADQTAGKYTGKHDYD